MVLAFDIGGTHIRRAVIQKGCAHHLDRHPSRDLAATLYRLTAESLERHPALKGVAISFAGQIQNGAICSAPNIDTGELQGRSIPAWFEENFGLLAAIDNDLKCAARAEAACYPDAQALAVLYIGTGFGGALIEKGQLICGSGNQAGEIGHIPFEPAPFRCGCGGESCLELAASGSGVECWCAALGLKPAPLSELKAQHTPQAEAICKRFERGLKHAIATLLPLFNPDRVVLGGGVIAHNPWLLATAQEATQGAFGPASHAEVCLSTLGDEANLIGASRLLAEIA